MRHSISIATFAFAALLAAPAAAQDAPPALEQAAPPPDPQPARPVPPPAPPATAARPATTPPTPPHDPNDPFGFPPCDIRAEDGTLKGTGGCAGVWGLRGAVTRVRGVSADDGVTLAFASEGQEYGRRGIFTTRATHRLGIGGGAAGFDGALAFSFAGGVRAPVAERHGPFVRVSMQGWVLGNDAFYSSILELPGVQIGYQYVSRNVVAELAGTSGVALVGRYRAGDAYSRTLGHGFDVGAHATLQIPYARLGVTVMRFPTDDDVKAPVTMAEGTLCLLAAPIAVCADGRAMRTDAMLHDGAGVAAVRSLYGGITAGFTRE